MSPRLTRIEQSQRNRALVLAAARRTFLACGYHGASLEQIADEAGFSKGVVYSQFESKADLFLALLEQRIEERAAENAQFAEAPVADGCGSVERRLRALTEHVTRRDQADAQWGLLVIEFRVHAARNPDLNVRYASLHERTIAGVASVVATIYERAGEPPPLAPSELARLLLTVSSGASLEHATNANVTPATLVAELLAGVQAHSTRRPRSGGQCEKGRMSAVTETGVEALQARFGATLARRLGTHIERLGWDARQLREFQRDELRKLLVCAVERSPFHGRRLAGIDPERFELEQLPELPTMSKERMMSSFDELLTDRRLTQGRVEDHLGSLGMEARLLDDRYVCLASGGSSGLRGVFVQTIEEYVEFVASIVRHPMASAISAGSPPPDGLTLWIIAAAAPVHSSGFGAAVATGYPVRLIPAPATLPVAEVVRRLNHAQPPALLAHTSKLVQLAAERRAGRLQIKPAAITAMAETVTTEDRATIETAFGIPLITQFTSTEGLVGRSAPGSAVISFAGDTCLVEMVDADNRPVPDGAEASKVLITNLHNHTQPLIRYELTDRFIAQPPDPGSGLVRATVEGRADDVFRYGELAVDPLVIRTVMVRTPGALEYQVRQTERGIDVGVILDGQVDHATLAASLQQSLRAAGLAEAQVRVHTVDDIARHPETGKARRFIPLTG